MKDELSIYYKTLNGTRTFSWVSERVESEEQVLIELEEFLRRVFNTEYQIRPKLSISTPKKLLMENAIKMSEEVLSNDELVNRLRTDYYSSKGYHEAEQFEFPFLKDVENGDAFEYMDSLHSKVL